MYEEDSHMDYEGDSFSYSQDLEVSTQQTQSTQQTTAPVVPPAGRDSHRWGYLQPVNEKLSRIDFWREQRRYTIGRDTEHNRIVFAGPKISNRHCEITWSEDNTGGTVLVLDLSSNGTFINGRKVRKGQTCILGQGDEIAFGTPTAQPESPFDYRFIYRHVAGGPPTTGLYAFYDIGTELGKGSFATVMKAVNRETGVWYAVKMIKDKTAGRGGDQQGRIRNAAIAREIDILEKLKHRNICEVKEVFLEENGSDINLVIELVEGGDLLEYFLKRGGLGERDAIRITYQICDALSYIHSQGITHRDLKPENILLTKDEPPVVKVADVGLAKIVNGVNMLGTLWGSPSYLAPEVLKQTDQQEGYENLVDSWSVGVIVFSMLTNASPFVEDENQTGLRAGIIERRIDWATLQAQNVSQEGFDFIVALLQEDPVNRMGLKAALAHPWLQSYIPEETSPADAELTLEPSTLEKVGKLSAPFPSMIFLPSGKSYCPPWYDADGNAVSLDITTSSTMCRWRSTDAMAKGLSVSSKPSDPEDVPKDDSGGSGSGQRAGQSSDFLRPPNGVTGTSTGTVEHRDEAAEAGEGSTKTDFHRKDDDTIKQTRKIRFSILGIVHQPNSKFVQELQINGEVTFPCTPARSSAQVQFTRMDCYSRTQIIPDTVQFQYSQKCLKVLVDTADPCWESTKIQPKATTASEDTEKRVEGGKAGLQTAQKGTVSPNLLRSSLTVEATQTGEESTSTERVYKRDRIKQDERQGVFRWDFLIAEENARAQGVRLADPHLPLVEMEYIRVPKVRNPDRLIVEVSSFWTLEGTDIAKKSSKTPESNQLPAPCYSNLCQDVWFDLGVVDAEANIDEKYNAVFTIDANGEESLKKERREMYP
ncbi:hypothetical protein EST38_g10681 [Candolleomyces aberdarensis]|uniref:Uncharacterized protein n=1 Tax=Candolleomyces aberdarensis TaxID=2316362 RepID=A0A4Q2D7H9_9AGAR|nr:hypothetical protein EST38_g10681 [Candolleomyces aberdarensis]